MEKEKRIISYFLGWLVLGFLICFIGISNVFAAEYNLNYDTYQRYYDNTGTLSEVNSSWNESLQSYVSGNLTTVNGSTGAAWLVSSPIPMVKGHQYSISFAFVERNNIALSSKNKIAVSNTVNGAVTNYNNSSYGAETIYSKVTGNTTLSFIFKANSNSSFIVIPFTTTSRVTQNYTVTMFVMEDLGTAGLSQEELNTTINNQTNTLNNSIQDSTDTITGEIDDMEQSIIESNKETQDVIKDQFNNCRDSINLIDESLIQSGNPYYYYMYLDNVNELYTLSIKIKDNGISKPISIGFAENNILPLTNYSWLMNEGIIGGLSTNNNFKYINNLQSYVYRKYVVVYLNGYTLNDLFDNYYIQLQKGNFTNYEEYGEEICTNKIDEQVETSKGIWATIKDLPNAFMNMLKGLFIPDDGYFEEWFNDLKTYFEQKLGFLATPFTIIIDFVNRYLQLNPNDDIVINIPNITVPNFEDHIIVKETTFNWSELLKSKESFNMLWELYLAFIDVFLILNFINLCENKYNRIFGGDTTPYEYYTVEDSYNVDINTGEVTNMRRNERKTTRKKVV